jgi:DNA invertase Pin-like site-specific DNA recombinase
MITSRPKFVAYFRVSTQKQGRSGLGLEAQQHQVRQYLFQAGGIELASFVEVESGKNADRPKLAAALQRCRQTRATLLVAKIDRLSRNAAFLFALRDAGVQFQALDIPEANTLTLGVMVSMTQHERELIAKRTREALAARKARGLPLGTPRPELMKKLQVQASELGCFANRAKAQERAKDIAPAILEFLSLSAIDTPPAKMAALIQECLDAGTTSLRKIAACLDEQGIQTPRGKPWTPTAVKNALEQLKAA